MIVTHETLHDAIMFATGALVVVLVSFLFPPERRKHQRRRKVGVIPKMNRAHRLGPDRRF